MMGGIGCFISSAITLLVNPSVEIRDAIFTISDRSFSLDPSLANMITQPNLSPNKIQSESHHHYHHISITMIVTTYPNPKLRITTKT